jgi:hypothetical protein
MAVEAAPRKAESRPTDQERRPPAAPEDTSVTAASPAREWPPPSIIPCTPTWPPPNAPGDVLFSDDERDWPEIPR